MAYATTADVAARLGTFDLDASSQPTVTEAAALLDERSGLLDAVLSSVGVTTPVTAPASFLDALKGWEAAGATADALAIKFPDGTGAGSVEETIAYWLKVWDDGIACLKDGSAIPASVAKVAGGLPSSYLTRNPDEDEDIGELAEWIPRRSRVY